MGEGDATHDISKVRPLTFQERSLIQTFPNNFKWGAANKSTLEQILGNAVPVKLARFVGMAVVQYDKAHAKPIMKSLLF
jgi:DNA (cytosine-5)-methyltransferase 1